MTRLRAWWESAPVVRIRLSLRLLTERRAALFITVDAMFLFAGVMIGLAGTGSVTEFWLPLFVMPLLVVGVPMLTDTVAVERRSGTLDLALTSPGARFYFERRVGAVANTGTGEAFVPVALRTSQGSLWQTLRVDEKGRAEFAFTADGEPHSVQLDPDRVCYRHAVIGLVENVEFRGPS